MITLKSFMENRFDGDDNDCIMIINNDDCLQHHSLLLIN